MNKYLLLPLLFAVNFSTPSVAAQPEYRACLFHDQLYAVVRWVDICDITLVDGIFAAVEHVEVPGKRLKRADVSFESLHSGIMKVDIPHDPECFTSRPY